MSGLEFEADQFALLFATEDAREGMNAFGEKRKPEFEEDSPRDQNPGPLRRDRRPGTRQQRHLPHLFRGRSRGVAARHRPLLQRWSVRVAASSSSRRSSTTKPASSTRLTLITNLAELGRSPCASITTYFVTEKSSSQATRHACIDLATGKPIRMPEELLELGRGDS